MDSAEDSEPGVYPRRRFRAIGVEAFDDLIVGFETAIIEVYVVEGFAMGCNEA